MKDLLHNILDELCLKHESVPNELEIHSEMFLSQNNI